MSKVLFNEGVAPDTPSAGKVEIYAKSDGNMYQKDDAGLETLLAGGGGGSSPLTTKGDLYTYDTDDQRLAVGTNDHILTADSAQATGMKWAAAPFTLISDSLLVSAAASFDFTSIPGTFNHLKIILNLRSDASATADNISLLVNNDTGPNYNYLTNRREHSGVNATLEGLAQASATMQAVSANTAPAGFAGGGEFFIPNYAETTFNKMIRGYGGNFRAQSTGEIEQFDSLVMWLSTAAITRLTISPVTGSNWMAGSRASLYGVT